MIRIVVAFSFVAACGGSKPGPAPTAPPPAAQHNEHEHEEMAKLPPEVTKFHDMLAPRWHAEKGPQRMKDTCAAVPDFTSGVVALAKAVPPTGMGDRWTNAIAALGDAVTGLDKTCKDNDAAAFEIAFGKLHQGFHGLIESGEGGEEHHE